MLAVARRGMSILNSLVAEILALRDGVQLAKEEEWPDVTFQYDCQVLVEMWN